MRVHFLYMRNNNLANTVWFGCLTATVLIVGTLTGEAQINCRYVTITTTNDFSTNTIQLQQGETGELTTFIPAPSLPNSPTVYVIKDGLQFPAIPATYWGVAATGVGTTVAGPAQFAFGVFSPALMTVKITPATYDVNKTLILPPGTNQVYVALQCSTNLVNWGDCTNGIYGTPTAATFFRMRMGVLNP